MQEIIAFFENLIRPLIDWWYAGGRAAVIAIVTSAPFLAVLGFILRLVLNNRADKIQVKRKQAEEEEARKAAAVEEMADIVAKEIAKHENH